MPIETLTLLAGLLGTGIAGYRGVTKKLESLLGPVEDDTIRDQLNLLAKEQRSQGRRLSSIEDWRAQKVA